VITTLLKDKTGLNGHHFVSNNYSESEAQKIIIDEEIPETIPTFAQENHHFEDLKSKQKHDQGKFHRKLMEELEVEHSKCLKKSVNIDKKFASIDSIQDDPAQAHTYDPLHHSQIPRKRHQSGNLYNNLAMPLCTVCAFPYSSQTIGPQVEQLW
jgi:hypothetical protein